MSVSLNGTNGITFNDASSQNTAATGFGFKNRIINGAMMIDQRNAGASYAQINNAYNLDRWKGYSYVGGAVTGKYTVQQNAGSVTPPVGFINYLGVTSSAATADGATNIFGIAQPIEGLNMADFGWGTANAATVTVSFWVRSSLTGTFGGVITNSAQNRSYPFTYTISSANTWEQKSVTIAGDTSGTWLTTNGVGLVLTFGLGVGSTYSGAAGPWAGTQYYSATGATSVVGTNGATFYITGVQLEKGSTATSFDYRPYGTELDLCMRYYQPMPQWQWYIYNIAGAGTLGSMTLPVVMRTTPTVGAGTYTNFQGATSMSVSCQDNRGFNCYAAATISNTIVWGHSAADGSFSAEL